MFGKVWKTVGNKSVLQWSESRVRVTLRLAVYRQSVRLGDKPLETHDQNFYFPAEHYHSIADTNFGFLFPGLLLSVSVRHCLMKCSLQ
jgi:hypothetical protein